MPSVKKIKKSKVYHVSQNKIRGKNYKKWRVRLAGSLRSIKYFDTQQEAIEYANDLVRNYGGSLLIHKLNGKVRKTNY